MRKAHINVLLSLRRVHYVNTFYLKVARVGIEDLSLPSAVYWLLVAKPWAGHLAAQASAFPLPEEIETW